MVDSHIKLIVPDLIIKHGTNIIMCLQQLQSNCRVTDVESVTISGCSNQNVSMINVNPADFWLPQPDHA